MQAKVWNRNVHPFKQEFRGEKIEIPAGGYIEMDYFDACQFRSLYFEPVKDGGGQQLPTSYKMIEVEKIPDLHEGQEKVTAFKSMLDGTLHESMEALLAYEKSHSQGAATDVDGAKIVRAARGPKKTGDVTL